MAFVFSFAILIVLWTAASIAFGEALVPSFAGTTGCLFGMVATREFWEHVSVTLFRAVAALAMTVILALATGIAAGRAKRLMDLVSPLVAFLQATPPILWVTLVMVWAGTGNVVPVAVVFASLFPPMFLCVSMAAASLDPRLFAMAKLYRVGKWRVVRDLILPGIFPHFLAGLSFALGSGLKVAAVAEFLGADRGIGARIYWAYRMMEMETLFAWALVLVGIGGVTDLFFIRPLRAKAGETGGGSA